LHKTLAKPDSLKLAQYHYAAGGDLLALQKLSEALAPLQQAQQMYVQAIKTTKTNLEKELAQTNWRLGYVLMKLGQYVTAHQTLLQAEKYFLAQYQQQKTPANINALAEVHYLLAHTAMYGRFNVLASTGYYITSTCLSTKYTSFPFKPITALRLMIVYFKTQTKK
jgi:tetratricopeptide (TPR) repeat protein